MTAEGDAPINLRLFASLREQAGWSERRWRIQPGITTPRDVWQQLNLGKRGGLRCAINQVFATDDHPLQANDELAFLPPISGG